MNDAGMKYDILRGADKEIFASWMQFSNATRYQDETINYEIQLEYMINELSNYHGINDAFNSGEMLDVLNKLYQLDDIVNRYIASHSNGVALPLPLHLSKMSAINSNAQKRTDLAQWIIDQRPIGGYNTTAEVQAAFDAFFAVAAPAVTADDEANTIVGADGTMEYSTNAGVDWFVYSSTNLPQFEGAQTVWVRVKATESTPVGPYVTLTFTENRGADPLEALNLAKVMKM